MMIITPDAIVESADGELTYEFGQASVIVSHDEQSAWLTVTRPCPRADLAAAKLFLSQEGVPGNATRTYLDEASGELRYEHTVFQWESLDADEFQPWPVRQLLADAGV